MKSTLTTILFAVFASSALADAPQDYCTRQSQMVSVQHPADAIAAIKVAYAKCMRDWQLKQINLYKATKTMCDATAATETTVADHDRVYKACMMAKGYVS